MHDSLFDPQELNVLANAEFFEYKARIDDKINLLFGQLKAAIETSIGTVAERLPADFPHSGSRIYRGEHHGPYPWRAVDCPAGFHRQDHLAYRCLLLWGHHFSFHFLLAGAWLDRYLPVLCGQLPDLAAVQLEMSLQDSPWQWQFDRQSHLPLQEVSAEKLRRQAGETGFLKLSRKHPLEASCTLVATGLSTWQALQQCLLD